MRISLTDNSLTLSTGRTGRIGNRGLATSFFTERDEDMGSVLARTLIECGQEVPEFLQHHVEGMNKNTVKFETESDFDEGDLPQLGDLNGAGGDDANNGQDSAAAGAWGGDDTANNNAGGDAGAWGADTGGNSQPAQAAAW